MHRSRYFHTLFLLVICASNTAISQPIGAERLYRMTYLTSDDGLSQNTVDCILRDSRGFMWFATWNGLNRYDGYSFKVYKRNETKNSISNNFVYSICEDLEGNLWIGTRNGLNRLKFDTDEFTNFFHDTTNTHSLSGNWVNTVYTTPKGKIWVGTNGNGLNKLVTENDTVKFIHYREGDSSALKINNNTINCIYTDSKARLWIGTSDGLTVYSEAENTSTVFLSNPLNGNSLTSSDIRCVFEDYTGTIWVGTEFGLNQWIEGTHNFVRYFNEIGNPRSLSHSNINAIDEDPEGNLYFATLGGLDVYNRAKNNFYRLPVHGSQNLSLNNEFSNSLLCDASGLVWVGTEKGGINRFNIYQKNFQYLSANIEEKVHLDHNTVNSILEEDNYLWIGTAGGGLNRINRNTGKVQYYVYTPDNLQSLSNDFVTSLYRDTKNNLWIGTLGGGFCKFIPEGNSGTFRYFQNTSDNEQSLVNNFVSSISEDSKGRIWIGTLGGVDLFNPETGKFVHMLANPKSGTPISEVGCLLIDSRGNLWIGTRKGLFFISEDQLDKVTDKSNSIRYHFYQNDPANPYSLNENYIISLFEDSRGKIWIGTYGNGINKLATNIDRPDRFRFTSYTQQDGLSNNVVYAILEDHDYNLWLSTDYGLSRFDIENNKFTAYYVADGLQSNQFYWSAACKGKAGILYFGGMKGVNYFNPEEIINNTKPPHPVLTDLKILNNQVNPGEPYGKRIILKKVISETDALKLTYRESTFSLEFSALSYQLPAKNLFAYRLTGVDEEWIEVPADRRFANYTKLPGGEYTFFLRAANNDGLWNETPFSLKILITPPFWKTGWFRVVLIIILSALIALYLHMHTRSLKQQKRKLEQLVKERTSQIEEQKLRLELQNTEILEQRDRLIQLNKKVKAVNQLKLKFFTNVSHEFRTPLTLILGPLEKLRAKWKADEESSQQLGLVTRNAERLLHLINQLMDFRKIEKGKMILHVREGNVSEFIENLLRAFKELQKQKNIALDFHSSNLEKRVWFDPEKLENILFNLLSNAFKYTPQGGKIAVRITFTNRPYESGHNTRKAVASEYLQVEVEDTGCGIDKEELPNIFRRFYQAEHSNKQLTGTGIGLSLTRDLVKVLNGTIQVKSEKEKGTLFTLSMPCSRNAFSDDEITKDRPEQPVLKDSLNMLQDILEQEVNREKRESVQKLEYQSNRPTILIVEDNFELQEFIAKQLNEHYNIIVANNGLQALDQAIEHNPDLIISDIMMPEMDGLQLCISIKERLETSHIPVILLTAKGSVENQIEGFRTGADDYIPKPFNAELLETRVTNLIKNREKLRQLFSKSGMVEPETIAKNPTDQKFLEEALAQIEKNLDNTEFNVNDFASGMCVSRSLLHKKLTALTDQSATDFINTIRLKKAKELMISGSYNISEIAYAVGYNDPKYFSRLFKKRFNLSPSEFLKELRSKAV